MLLEASGLTLGYGGRPVVKEVSLELGEGEVLVVAGPNGAGKTTLIRGIARLLRPMEGTVLVDGEDVWSIPLDRASRLISYLPPPPPRGFNIRVVDLVASMMQPYLRGMWPSREALSHVLGVLSEVGALDLAYRRVDELSSGELRRIMLAATLLKPSRLVLLDEPVVHLDLRFQAEAAGLIRRIAGERRVGVLAATHNLTIASMLADRIALMSKGRIRAIGPPGDVLRPGILESIYGVRVEVLEFNGIRAVVPRPEEEQ